MNFDMKEYANTILREHAENVAKGEFSPIKGAGESVCLKPSEVPDSQVQQEAFNWFAQHLEIDLEGKTDDQVFGEMKVKLMELMNLAGLCPF